MIDMHNEIRYIVYNIYTVSQKSSTPNYGDNFVNSYIFQFFFTGGKRNKFPTKPIQDVRVTGGRDSDQR